MSKRILIVDDVPENIKLAANILTNNGYLVEYATNGEDALDWVENEKFDLVLLDVRMPGMDGFEVCNKIRENKDNDNLPIIFLSAITDKELTIKGLKSGAQDFATKPYNSSELLSRIEIHIELSDARNKLSNMNQILEDKVKERTLELENAMTDLKIAKDKVDERNRLTTAFLANMSHEIRTPLIGILGYSKIILFSELNEEEKKEYLEYLNLSSNRLIKLIDNLIDISMIDTGQLEITENTFNLHELLNSILEMKKTNAVAKNLDIKLDLNLADNEISIDSDQKRVNQCIEILLDNAIKFTAEGSITLAYKIYKKEIIFSVKDTGIGISEDSKKIIFERFRQVDSKLNRAYEGSGIGLSILKGLIKLLNGKVWVKSEIGKGSTFYFSIPMGNNLIS